MIDIVWSREVCILIVVKNNRLEHWFKQLKQTYRHAADTISHSIFVKTSKLPIHHHLVIVFNLVPKDKSQGLLVPIKGLVGLEQPLAYMRF